MPIRGFRPSGLHPPVKGSSLSLRAERRSAAFKPPRLRHPSYKQEGTTLTQTRCV